MTQTKLETSDSGIRVIGVLDRPGAEALVAAIRQKENYTVDIAGVSEVKFAALRALMDVSRNERRICFLNACDAVAERFEDTGVSFYVDVCRKPKPLRVGEYDEFGAGFLSKAYNSEDGDSVMKVYGPRVPRWLVAHEKTIARAVMMFGIPTPLVGSLYEDAENTALDFERIEGKRSFSRIISEEPERMREITEKFARMCRQLHSTECDTKVFPDRKIFYRRAVGSCTAITEEERQKALAFIDNIPAATTCLHGDMQLSNTITDGTVDMWIDLSDFSYGSPLMDMGMWYFLSKLNPEHLCQSIFHLSKPQMAQIWDIFVEEYYGATTDAKKQEVERMILPYAALHMLYLGSMYRFEPGMLDFIRQILFA